MQVSSNEVICDWCEAGTRRYGRIRKYADGSEMHPACHKVKLDIERAVRELDPADIEKVEALKAEMNTAERKYRSAMTRLAKKCGVPRHTLREAMEQRAEQQKAVA